MNDLIIAFVLGGVCWEYHSKIIAFVKTVYADLMVDSSDETAKQQPSKSNDSSNNNKSNEVSLP